MDITQPDFNDTFGFSIGDSDGNELANKITKLAAQINAATYEFLKLVAEFDRCGGWAEVGVKSCAHWLNWKCGIALGAAREKVRVAHCLEALPLTNAAFKGGELSYSVVRALTRVATNENEAYLLEIAANSSASEVELAVRKFQQVGKVLSFEELMQKRGLTFYQNHDGMWVIKATLPQDSGALLVNALKAIVDKLDNSKNVPAETPEPELKEELTLAQQQADAICAMSEHYIACAKCDGELKSLAGHERCQVVLHMNADTLKHEHHCGCDHDHSDQQHQPCHMDGHWISMANAKRFSCDTSILSLIEDKDRNPLWAGRKARTVTGTQKIALDARDETCQFPGCCESRFVEFHHVEHWGALGETNPDNLVKLCRFHHGILHDGKYNIEVEGDQDAPIFIFKMPNGRVIKPVYRLPQTEKTTVDDTLRDFAQRWPNIDSDTVKPFAWPDEINQQMVLDDMIERTDCATDRHHSGP